MFSLHSCTVLFLFDIWKFFNVFAASWKSRVSCCRSLHFPLETFFSKEIQPCFAGFAFLSTISFLWAAQYLLWVAGKLLFTFCQLESFFWMFLYQGFTANSFPFQVWIAYLGLSESAKLDVLNWWFEPIFNSRLSKCYELWDNVKWT